MKNQTHFHQQNTQPNTQETPIQPLMNSMVNPEGIVPEPISQSVQKAEQHPPQHTTQNKLHNNKAKKLSRDSLMHRRVRPEMQGQEDATHVDSERQLQADLKYTSTMKKNKEMNHQEAEQKVDSIVDRSDNVLMKLKGFFPFDFFPNTVIIDANKVSIVDKMFFASETVTTILLEEITDVVVQSNFFLGQLIITYSHHPLRPLKYKIPSLKKQEALKAQEIIQGLIVLRISEGIDISKLQPEEITKELANIGRTHESVKTL